MGIKKMNSINTISTKELLMYATGPRTSRPLTVADSERWKAIVYELLTRALREDWSKLELSKQDLRRRNQL